MVAVIDSGVDYTDPDLAANIWTNPNAGQDGFSGDLHGYNFVDNTGNPMDDYGHGTFVAGEIGAVGNNGMGVAGVNWNVTIMPLKFLDANGDGYTSDAIRAINYAVMERTEYGVNVRVINASWCEQPKRPRPECGDPGGGQRRDPRSSPRRETRRATTTRRRSIRPAPGLPNVVSVAASDSSDQLASFSDYGPNTVNLAAPGVDIYGTLPGGKYGYLSGTSMAAPLVSGAAALAWAADPNATVAQVRSALLQGVNQVPALAGKVSSGGCLNAYNTLKLLTTPRRRPHPLPLPPLSRTTTPSAPASHAVPAITSLGQHAILSWRVAALIGPRIRRRRHVTAWHRPMELWRRAIGSIAVSGGQATISIGTGSLTAGSYRLFARAVDTDGQWSSAVSTVDRDGQRYRDERDDRATAVAVAIGSTARATSPAPRTTSRSRSWPDRNTRSNRLGLAV